MRAATIFRLGGAILGPGCARLIICLLLALATVGFARAPFARWAHGKITAIHPGAATFSLRDESSSKVLVFHWNSETRLWTEPLPARDRGVTFDPKNLQVGAEVRVMFKKFSEENRASRIICISPISKKSGKKT